MYVKLISKYRGRVRKTLSGGFTSLLVKTCTVPPRGTPWILGTLRLQAKPCGISEKFEPPRYSVYDPLACGYALALTNTIT